MPKPLNLFIHQPSQWRLVHAYGSEQLAIPPRSGGVHSDILLETTIPGSGELFAAASGKLSVRSLRSPLVDPLEEFVITPDPEEPLPDTVNLYLHISPLISNGNAFKQRTQPIGNLLGFAYLGVEAASLEASLGDLLDKAVIPPSSVSREMLVKQFLLGTMDIPVTAGHALGKASTKGAPVGSRRIGFAVFTDDGPFDPSYTYDWMRDFVADGQPELDAFLTLVPKGWPLISPSITKAQAIAQTAVTPYPMPVLQEVRTTHNLTPTEWRQVGNNQKQLWRERLLKRVGHAPANSTVPPFEFNDQDAENLFQLEAIVEFYANFDEPWASGAVPHNPGHQDYKKIDFLDPTGTAATAVDKVVTLDGTLDLSKVRVNYDTLLLEGDNNPARESRLYRITAVNQAAHTVTLDTAPILAAPSAWQLKRQPILVVIDSFGVRNGLQGRNATVAQTTTPSVLSLDGLPNNAKINAHFDTIYLPSDTARASRTYRITAIDTTQRTVTLDGNPALEGGSSAWHIPAGLSGELPVLDYNLGPGSMWNPPRRVYDQYDGLSFIVHNGTVRKSIRLTSYTSHNAAPEASEKLTSIRGNREYNYRSRRSPLIGASTSGPAYRNYCFVVEDPGQNDQVADAYYYFRSTVNVPRDANGKGAIRIHHGNRNMAGGGSGSEGCIVSPEFFELRTQLISVYQDEYRAIHGAIDTEVQKANGRNHEQSKELWNHTHNATGSQNDRLSAANWDNKIVGTLWVIRPDERPKQP